MIKPFFKPNQVINEFTSNEIRVIKRYPPKSEYGYNGEYGYLIDSLDGGQDHISESSLKSQIMNHANINR